MELANASVFPSSVENSSAAVDNPLNRTDPGHPPPPPPYFQMVLNQVVVPVLFGTISFVGTVGNILVIHVIVSNRKMRTVTNLMLLNLAFADLAFVLIVPPSTAYHFATSSWPFGDIPCRLMHYLVNVTAYVTVYTLVLISVVRYTIVVFNAETASVRTPRNVVISVAAIWGVVLSLNAPILGSYGVTVAEEEEEEAGAPGCDHRGEDVARKIFLTFFLFAYVLPLSVIGVFSLGILRHINRNRMSGLADGALAKTSSDRRKRRTGRLLVVVVVLFAILWLPVHVHLLVAYFGSLPESDFYSAVSVACYCLAYFNSCVNPIVYNHTSKSFRGAFRAAIRCGLPGRHDIGILGRLRPMTPGPGDLNAPVLIQIDLT